MYIVTIEISLLDFSERVYNMNMLASEAIIS